jgi:hypothetical protein
MLIGGIWHGRGTRRPWRELAGYGQEWNMAPDLGFLVVRLEGLEPPARCLEGTAELWLNVAESVLNWYFTMLHRLGVAWKGLQSAHVGSPFGSPRTHWHRQCSNART